MKYALFTLAITLHVLATAQSKKPVVYFPPPNNWEHRSAATVGLDSVLLLEAITYAKDHESKEPRDLKKAHYQSNFGREPFGYPRRAVKRTRTSYGFNY